MVGQVGKVPRLGDGRGGRGGRRPAAKKPRVMERNISGMAISVVLQDLALLDSARRKRGAPPPPTHTHTYTHLVVVISIRRVSFESGLYMVGTLWAVAEGSHVDQGLPLNEMIFGLCPTGATTQKMG